MVFSSLIFMTVFLPITILLYYVIQPIAWKNTILLLFSFVFYAWGEPKYIVLLIISVVLNYIFGILIHRANCKGSTGWRKTLLAFSVLFNIGLLVYFKYFAFIVQSANTILHTSLLVKEITLPIGISFYTFQGLSYVIDVYREPIESEKGYVVQKSFIALALYISMFPQLIAGPIVRYHDIKPYIQERKHGWDQFARGIEIFILGLAKKVLLANMLGKVVDEIMIDNVNMINAPIAWIGAIFYTLQLFYDFSGYSQMAIGLGHMFGFEFQINFDYPYISRSITEFWRRWHISLSQWFRDYLYIPLGGSRKGNVYFNLLIVFLATGIWHGASVGFIIWGLWHGLFIIIERYCIKNEKTPRVPGVLKWMYTMFVVLLGWVLFRIVSVSQTLSYLSIMFGIKKPEFISYSLNYYVNARTAASFIIAILCCVPWKSILILRIPSIKKIINSEMVVFIRRIAMVVLLIICYLFISNSTYNPFIYFRF